ncbi:MAG: hypothetical protein MUE85_10655 [Microscillaceae bacterium]|jgi:hypothetical protein|nr:hypothetical protein [Microscillaceae bacterium]
MRKIFLVGLVWSLLGLATPAYAQEKPSRKKAPTKKEKPVVQPSNPSKDADFEKEKRKQADEFGQLKTQQEKVFRQYRRSLDEAFLETLRKNWRNYAASAGFKSDSTVKPNRQPVADEQAIITTKPQDISQIPNRPFRSPDSAFTNKSTLPSIVRYNLTPSEETAAEAQNNLNVSYFDTPIALPYPQDMRINIPAYLNERVVADYWQNIIQKDYLYFLQQILKYRVQMQLNDWAYYQLLRSIAYKISNGEANQTRLFTWFMLLQSGYKAKIAYNENQIFILLPTKSKIYRNTYYKFDNLNYYVMDAPGGVVSLNIFTQDYPEAQNIISLDILKDVRLNDKIAYRSLGFAYKGKEYAFSVAYNPSFVEFSKDYPLTDPYIFFRAEPGEFTRKSLIDNLKPIVADMSELSAVNFLLAFVQKSFAYQTDQEQFGREKTFFIEETLHYMYSDCEDRAILFAYLVGELLGLPVIGLDYPGHIATAVSFKQDYTGDFTMFNQQKYLICDPTYIGAAVGNAMSNYVNLTPEVIVLE